MACTVCGSQVQHSTTGSKTGAASSLECVCDLGATGVAGGPCVACAVDHFKSAVGDAPCSTCGPHLFTAGQTGERTPHGCVCAKGFTGPDGGACVDCAENRYKDAFGAQVCTSCPDHSNSTRGSTANDQCNCSPGWQRDGQACVWTNPCTDNENDCSEEATCSHTGPSQHSCACNGGYLGTGVSCSSCGAARTYKNSVSNAAHCTECPVHQMTLSTASKDQAACVCEPGHSGEYCSPCEHGYKPDPGPASCTSCSIFDENSVTTSSTTGAVSSGSCVCEMGYTGSPPACVACAAGNYKDAEANKMSCTPCGINTFSPKIAATGPLTCQQCPSNTSSEVASNAAAICRCDQGFGGSVQGSAVAISNCSLCQPGTFYSVRYVFFFFFSSSSLN